MDKKIVTISLFLNSLYLSIVTCESLLASTIEIDYNVNMNIL